MSESKISPIRYADGLYYVGTKGYPAWILESSDGLIMIDTAMPADLDFILNNFRKLGFDVKDVKHIIHSHGHIDHVGCTKKIVEMTGAKTYIGKGDEEAVRGNNELQWTNEFDMKYEGAFEPDVIISDGDEIEIGGRRFKFVSTPGHTAGTLSFFFNVTDSGKEYRAGMFGGAGLNSLLDWYLEKYSLPTSLRTDFVRGIERVIDEHVDIHLGNHLANNNHEERVKLIGKVENPFIDANSWRSFLKAKREEAKERFGI